MLNPQLGHLNLSVDTAGQCLSERWIKYIDEKFPLMWEVSTLWHYSGTSAVLQVSCCTIDMALERVKKETKEHFLNEMHLNGTSVNTNAKQTEAYLQFKDAEHLKLNYREKCQ